MFKKHTHRLIYGKRNVFNHTNNNYYPYFDLGNNIVNLFLGVHKASYPLLQCSIYFWYYNLLLIGVYHINNILQNSCQYVDWTIDKFTNINWLTIKELPSSIPENIGLRYSNTLIQIDFNTFCRCKAKNKRSSGFSVNLVYIRKN